MFWLFVLLHPTNSATDRCVSYRTCAYKWRFKVKKKPCINLIFVAQVPSKDDGHVIHILRRAANTRTHLPSRFSAPWVSQTSSLLFFACVIGQKRIIYFCIFLKEMRVNCSPLYLTGVYISKGRAIGHRGMDVQEWLHLGVVR